MWLDSASNIDLLFYSPYAHTITDIVRSGSFTPLTIGLYGSWGAGKSSMLKIIQDEMRELNDIVCINLNAWQFEGYEDAKIAIMESLLNSLKANVTLIDKIKDNLQGLLKRVDYFKIAKTGISKGLPYLVSAVTGNPIPLAMNLTADITSVTKIPEHLKKIKDEFLKAEEPIDSITENVRKFREEFAGMLRQVDNIKNFVIIIDDLDRCTPEHIIETLEAIKLFLSVEKTTFIIAVDQRIIEYSVKVKYPEIDDVDVSVDYIEKIIQLPIQIPRLSSKDIENYMLLLVCQYYLEKDWFDLVLSDIYAQKLTLSDTPLLIKDLMDIVEEKNPPECMYDEAFEKDLKCISNIAHVVSSSLKGNPRQAKRFLNTFVTRRRIARLYFGDDVNDGILAKLLALEFMDSSLFNKLYEWNKSFDKKGKNSELAKIEQSIDSDQELDVAYASWNNPRIRRWISAEPLNLSDVDLSQYFYLSRESLKEYDLLEERLSKEERKFVERCKDCMGQEQQRIDELRKMPEQSQSKIVGALLNRFRDDVVTLNLISKIYINFKDVRSDIVDILKTKNSFSFSDGVHLLTMKKVDEDYFNSYVKDLSISKKIQNIINEGM